MDFVTTENVAIDYTKVSDSKAALLVYDTLMAAAKMKQRKEKKMEKMSLCVCMTQLSTTMISGSYFRKLRERFLSVTVVIARLCSGLQTQQKQLPRKLQNLNCYRQAEILVSSFFAGQDAQMTRTLMGLQLEESSLMLYLSIGKKGFLMKIFGRS